MLSHPPSAHSNEKALHSALCKAFCIFWASRGLCLVRGRFALVNPSLNVTRAPADCFGGELNRLGKIPFFDQVINSPFGQSYHPAKVVDSVHQRGYWWRLVRSFARACRASKKNRF